MRTVKWFLISVLTVLTACCFIVGCNTIHGAGKNIEKTGQVIERASE
ncbi:MAG: hypothetical protein P8Z79_12300 [Sedimentisphaerales bacterium]